MADQVMADRDSPNLKIEAFGDEPHESQAVHARFHHQDRFVHKPYETRRKPRNTGRKALSKLTQALARSSLTIDKRGAREAYQAEEQQASEQVLTDQDTGEARQSNSNARNSRGSGQPDFSSIVPAEQAKFNGEDGHNGARKTRSMTGKLPLGFDNMYLSSMGNKDTFMNNGQIRTWIESVYDPHLKKWYHKCLSSSVNRSRLKAAREDPFAFARTVLREAIDQHDSSRLLQALLGEKGGCPTAFHLDLRQRNSLTFVQHAAMVACLVVRDGRRGGLFATCADEKTLHRAAVMLLISVIMDLKNKEGLFSRLLIDTKKGTSAPKAKKKKKQQMKQSNLRKMSKTVNVPLKLSDRVEKALRDRKELAIDCQFRFQRSKLAGGALCPVHLVGSLHKVNASEKAIRMLVQSFTT